MRVGIVGTGSMGRAHARGWSSSGATLVGFYADETDTAVALARHHHARVFGDLDALLDEVDVIDLCVPSDLHRTMTERAAKAGKHVICEKPMALDVRDARAMIEACNTAGVRLFIAHVVRFFPQYRRAAELVQGGAIGDLGVLRLKRVAYPPHAGEPSWFADERRSGGMVFDLMIHDLDYARMLGGPVERVYARGIPTPSTPPERGTPRAYTLATLRFESGAMALVEAGWAYPAGTFRTGFDMAGRDGLLEWSSDETATLRAHVDDANASASAVGLPLASHAEDPYTTELHHVHDALRHGTPFDVTPEDALEAVRLATAVRRSMATGRPVALGEVT